MFYSLVSAVLSGIDAVIVNVEIDISLGIPVFDMTGALAASVKEAKERVKIAIKNSGYVIQPGRITVNISPAGIRKAGTLLDLPIAIGVLGNMGFVNHDMIKNTLVVGELSLDGAVQPVDGILPIVMKAKETGIKRVVIPALNLKEASFIEEIDIIPVKSLKDSIEVLTGRMCIDAPHSTFMPDEPEEVTDEIIGQDSAKRASAIAVAGRHNLIYIGPPGVGKTMMARILPSIMPPLTLEESIELSRIYSVKGLISKEEGLVRKRPFRSPYHKISVSAMIGGGVYPLPGEVSLADYGILFLDELPLFDSRVLAALRIPLEDRRVHIGRASGQYTFPAHFILAGAMNPCACGFYPDRNRCTCTRNDINRYFGRIEKPFLDRIDISVEMPLLSQDTLRNRTKNITIEDMKKLVDTAVSVQKKRYEDENINYNSELSAGMLEKYCPLTDEARHLLDMVYEKKNLSVRVYNKIIKVARTIADTTEEELINVSHISEAISYRVGGE